MNRNNFTYKNYTNEDKDTIAAISTPLGTGGIGIVRLSGPLSIHIASEIFRHKGKTRKTPDEFYSHHIYYGTIIQPDKKVSVDEVLLIVMRKPRTYTKEDVVEINCHGGLLVVKKVLEIVTSLGARIAEPGEFTKIAFLNGRIDLSQAEAVIDIIESNNEKNLKSSLYQLSGGLREKISNLKNRIIELNTKMEAPMDFPDQGIIEMDRNKIRENLEDCLLEVNSLLETVKYGQIIKEGICCVILGKTNVGKSSLFNLLLKKNRSIVTSLPGTTRDIIEESINIEGFTFNLIDTAGMKNPENIVEEISLDKVNEFMNNAQIFLLMFDISKPLDEQDIALIEKIIKIKNCGNRSIKIIVIENKTDLPQKMEIETLHNKLGIKEAIKISIKKKTGINVLENKMLDIALSDVFVPESGLIVNNKRHQEYLLKVHERLTDVISGIDTGVQEDLLAMDLRYTANQLARITGESCDLEMLNDVFSKFCIGK
jgi:tRNA modification GTPase